MKRTFDQTSYYRYQKEPRQNPFTGFMSFQHFRGEKMYSDMVVKPERNFTETEHFECYPVPDYVEENGREEGYYPDTSVVYIRSLWKEFEPQQGVYNYGFIQDIIDQAKAHDQTLCFRLMAHSTRARDDVPDWLKKLIPCPERPEGMRVKDSPTDPLFLELFGKAIAEIGQHFDNDPTFDIIDICLPGAWGEGHKLELYSEESMEKLFRVYSENFRHTRLIGQLARINIINQLNAEGCSVGARGDGLGQPRLVRNHYIPQMVEAGSLWEKAPVSFESYWWLCEWERQGWDLDAIIQLTLQWHISSFNAKSMPIPMAWKDKIDYWVSKMGYHYVIDYVKYPKSAQAGDGIEVQLGIDNVGVAPIYTRIPLFFRLRGQGYSFDVDPGFDVTKWMPGKRFEETEITLPDDIPSGVYDLELGLVSPDYPQVYFSTDAEYDGGFYKVGSIRIG